MLNRKGASDRGEAMVHDLNHHFHTEYLCECLGFCPCAKGRDLFSRITRYKSMNVLVYELL